MARLEFGLFDQVADAVRAQVADDLGSLRTQARRWGIKAWFDLDDCPRGHYEAQVLGAKHVPEAEILALEVGFHAEYPKAADNEAAMTPLHRAEKAWRSELGPAAVAGPFLGRPRPQRPRIVLRDCRLPCHLYQYPPAPQNR